VFGVFPTNVVGCGMTTIGRRRVTPGDVLPPEVDMIVSNRNLKLLISKGVVKLNETVFDE
jgi:hypothetical protein